MTLDEVRAIPDPVKRAEMAMELVAEATKMMLDAQVVRDLAFNDLRYKQGESIRAIAARFGVSKSLVATVTG